MSKFAPKNLTIIILTYNSAHVVKSCLEKINLSRYEVMLVDNASKDGTAELIKKNFPQVKIIKLGKNLGYGNGNNVALNQVNTDFALILNPDAVIDEKNTELVLEMMKEDETIACAGPIILEKVGNFHENLGAKSSEDKLYTDFVSGAVIFLRMSIFKKIGFFDPNIFMFYEDNEICRRAKKHGYQNVIITTATAFHLSGRSSASSNSLKNIYKKSWHFNGWSKLYWKEMIKGTLRAKVAAIRMALVYFLKAIIFLLILNLKEAAGNLGASLGSFSFLIGRKSFKK